MFDTEKFIFEIEQRPAIYDMQSEDYANKQAKWKCWAEVGESMHEDWHEMTPNEKDQTGKELMKKWKAIRDNFVRELKTLKKTETGETMPKKKKYIYFDILLFLLPHVKGSENATSVISPLEETWYPGVSIEQADLPDADQKQTLIPDSRESFHTRRRAKKRARRLGANKSVPIFIEQPMLRAPDTLTDTLSDNVCLPKDEGNSDRYGNRAFLLSFAPIMDSLPQHLFLQARMKIAGFFNDIANNSPPNADS